MAEDLLRIIAKSEPNRVVAVLATHNEISILKTLKTMDILGLGVNEEATRKFQQVCFAQLYGMADNLTYPLAHAGFQVGLINLMFE